jgi:phage shock protein PspC (stress-responsive transcriptional regulator)
MQKVIIVNLNGNAYQLDEPAYQLMRAYLERAADKLAGNPDKDEILADIEQAVADKCSRYLGAHKTVVLAAEVEQIVTEMGPIDGASAAEGEASAQQQPNGPKETSETGSGAPKRLYQIRDGAMISGVCNGIAAYFNVDPTVVRAIFVVLAFVTAGLWVFVYLVLMFVIPFAKTSEEHAAAHGLPFNTQELIEQAKKKYAEFRDSNQWKWQWKRQRREWRAQRRAWKQQRQRNWVGSRRPGRWSHRIRPVMRRRSLPDCSRRF